MRKNFGVKAWTYPQPVFIIAAYNEEGKANAMNAAWGGISEEDQISVCISAAHKTTKNIEVSHAFTVSMATADTVVPCDYVGIFSGNNVPDKIERAGFHTFRSEVVNAPVIGELPMTLECELIDYDPDTCILRGRIVNVSADESIIGDDGKIDIKKLRPITFDPVHNAYCEIGDKVGNAFIDGRKIK